MFIPDLKGPDKEKQYNNFTFLDKGGMGQVYKAFDNHNNITVAIKFIPIRNADEEKLLSREIKVSKEIESENLVKTYFIDKIELNNTEYFYIVQYFYEQGNLRTIIQKDIAYDKCLKMFLDLLNGLKALHTKIIHRDLKPENILIDENNLVITDFGLAKFIGEKTKTNSFKGAGTIPYMSPECWLNHDNKIQMDIYSLGIIFYELLTGEFPFNARTEEEWKENHIFVPLPNISEKRKEIPTKIQQVISKMTNKRESDRYSNVEEIIDSIQQSIKQSEESNKEIEKLASISHKKTEEIKTERLKAEQERQKKEEYKKLLNFHIVELKNKVESIIVKLNFELEENKISLKEDTSVGESFLRSFNLSVNGKIASFQFHSERVIEKYEEDRKQTIQNRIRASRRELFHSAIEDSIFKKKDIIYLGMVETNYQNPALQECFGFNLILVKSEKDIYGKWYIASFSDSGFSQRNRSNFALDLQYFLEEFEKSFIMHTLSVEYRELEDKDIYRLIEEIIQ